jgi:hypothetical protein
MVLMMIFLVEHNREDAVNCGDEEFMMRVRLAQEVEV